jgi:hypothetical protein
MSNRVAQRGRAVRHFGEDAECRRHVVDGGVERSVGRGLRRRRPPGGLPHVPDERRHGDDRGARDRRARLVDDVSADPRADRVRSHRRGRPLRRRVGPRHARVHSRRRRDDDALLARRDAKRRVRRLRRGDVPSDEQEDDDRGDDELLHHEHTSGSRPGGADPRRAESGRPRRLRSPDHQREERRPLAILASEPLAQHRVRALEARPHRLDGKTEPVRDLRRLGAVEVAEQDDLAVRRVERDDGVHHRAVRLGSCKGLVGRRRPGPCHDRLTARAALVAAPELQRDVAGDACQPRTERHASPRRPLDRGDERLLEHVVRRRRVGDDPERQPPDPHCVRQQFIDVQARWFRHGSLQERIPRTGQTVRSFAATPSPRWGVRQRRGAGPRAGRFAFVVRGAGRRPDGARSSASSASASPTTISP